MYAHRGHRGCVPGGTKVTSLVKWQRFHSSKLCFCILVGLWTFLHAWFREKHFHVSTDKCMFLSVVSQIKPVFPSGSCFLYLILKIYMSSSSEQERSPDLKFTYLTHLPLGPRRLLSQQDKCSKCPYICFCHYAKENMKGPSVSLVL